MTRQVCSLALRVSLALVFVLSLGVTTSAAAPSRLPAAAFHPAGQPTPLAAVQLALTRGQTCYMPGDPASTTCPITFKLLARFRHLLSVYRAMGNRTGAGSYFLRGNGTAGVKGYRLVSQSASRAIVNSLSEAGYSGHQTWALVRWRVGWLINNAWCTGYPQTSLYTSGDRLGDPPPCH